MPQHNAIDIYLRVRPCRDPSESFKLNQETKKAEFYIEKDRDQGYVNNKQEIMTFQFNDVFDVDTSQEKMFDKVAKEIVQAALQGYNGTIFAYGQTGSGKTFTMSGGAISYDDRGLIPRTLTHIFNASQEKASSIKVKVSYMQIYNSVGYDLLSDGGNSKELSSLTRIQPQEAANGELLLKGLLKYTVENEEEAMTQLLKGEDTRAVCRTSKNDESTRSHCIFSVEVQASMPGTDIKNVATIRLVDLSGSERIKETGVTGKLEKEAIGINLGLHYLQNVIVELNEQARGKKNVHVSYRNSLMTLVLRDSIGGNCMTRMVATVSAKPEDIPESISTCRFAMRVALIKNEISRNEAVDPGIIIARLKNENAQLKAELALLKGQDFKEDLDKYDIEDCHRLVDQYIESNDPTAAIILNDRLKINQCYYYFKSLLQKGGAKSKADNISDPSIKEADEGHVADEGRLADEMKKLRLIIQQKDNQIAMLVTAIKDRRGNGNLVMLSKESKEEQSMLRSVIKERPIVFKQEQESMLLQKGYDENTRSAISSSNRDLQFQQSSQQGSQDVPNGLSSEEIQKMLLHPVNLSTDEMLNEALALEKFRKSYRKREAMEKNAAQLQERMIRGQELGKIISQMRKQMEILKLKLEQLKRENAVQSLVDGKNAEDKREEELRDQILELKGKSKPYTDQLRSTKAAYDSLNILQKKLKEQLESDFQKWMIHFVNRRQNQVRNIDSSLLASGVKDKEVSKNLESFLKAQEQIRRR